MPPQPKHSEARQHDGSTMKRSQSKKHERLYNQHTFSSYNKLNQTRSIKDMFTGTVSKKLSAMQSSELIMTNRTTATIGNQVDPRNKSFKEANSVISHYSQSVLIQDEMQEKKMTRYIDKTKALKDGKESKGRLNRQVTTKLEGN